MKRFEKTLLFLGLIAVVAVAACFFAERIFQKSPAHHHDTLHDWIHEQLEQTAEQEKQLEPIERRFREQRQHYLEVIRLGDMELAQAILQDKGDSPAVRAAIEKIHQAHGDLQKITIEHVFEMRAVLTPEQYEKLLNLTANALYQIKHDH
jgi:nickel and cobalt resistance protein CnrR